MVRNYKRKTNRASYPREKLEEAVRAIQSGKISSYAASRSYQIPRSTIMTYIYRGNKQSQSMGRSPALPTEVERNLVTCLRELEKHGFELSKDELLNMVARYVKRNDIKTPFRNGIPGKEWLNAFQRRHNFSSTQGVIKTPSEAHKSQAEILRNQSVTLSTQSEMLRSQAEILRAQVEALSTQSEVLKTQSEVLKSQSEMLRTESNDPLNVLVKFEEEEELEVVEEDGEVEEGERVEVELAEM